MGSMRTMREAMGPCRASAMDETVAPMEWPTSMAPGMPRCSTRAARSAERVSQLSPPSRGSEVR